MTPSTEGAKVGRRRSQRTEFPRHRVMAKRRNSCLVQAVESKGAARWAMDSPKDLMMEMVSSASPPRASATTGINVTPAERQAERWEVSFSHVRTDTHTNEHTNGHNQA